MEIKEQRMSVKNREDELYRRALEIAERVHAGQTDKGGADYIGHPRRVAGYCMSDKAKIVALLHDTIEDTEVTPEYLLSQGFSQEIVDGVLAVTRKDEETYEEFVERAATNSLGREVKLADLRDNMDITRLCYPLGETDLERLNKYLKAYKYLSGKSVNEQ